MIDTTQGTAQAANTSTTGAYGSTGATQGTDSADGTEDRFLKLLVAQMRNQDPLNPLDNAQVTSQLAQINTVRGIEQLNRSMATVAANSGAVSPLSAVGLLGRQVLVAGDDFEWSGSNGSASNPDPSAPDISTGEAKTVRVGFELPATARTVRFEIVDAKGEVVHARDYDAPEAGVHSIDWDGVDTAGGDVAAGRYRLRAYGIDDSGGESRITTLVPARVNGINQAADGARLQFVGRQALPASAIRAVL